MESSLIFRICTDSSERANLIARCLGPDAPIFSDELDVPDRPVFEALEDFFSPDNLTRFDTCGLELHWITGSNLGEEISAYCKAFIKAGVQRIVGYYWSDEDEGFFFYKDKKLRSLHDWKKRVKILGVERNEDGEDEFDGDDEFDWVSLVLADMQKTEFN